MAIKWRKEIAPTRILMLTAKYTNWAINDNIVLESE